MTTLPLFGSESNIPLKRCLGPCGNLFPATAECFYRNKAKKDGLCTKCKQCDHLARRSYYRPSSRPQKNYSVDESQFWSKVDKSDGCWLWSAALDHRGYGRFHTYYRTGKPHHLGAHRMAYILTYGDIPDGLVVCHHCDNPPCVRPDHLFLGTLKDNSQDSVRKGRNSPPPRNDGDLHWTRRQPEKVRKGEKHPTAKLSLEQVRTIRAQYRTGNCTLLQLGQQYGVNKTCIHKIVNNFVWQEED